MMQGKFFYFIYFKKENEPHQNSSQILHVEEFPEVY